MKNEDAKTYKVSWERGRFEAEFGHDAAIGIYFPGSVTVTAETPKEALRKAKETHKHAMFPTVKDVTKIAAKKALAMMRLKQRFGPQRGLGD